MGFKTAEIFAISLFVFELWGKDWFTYLFNSAHLKKKFHMAKSAHTLEFECVGIFFIPSTFQKIFKE